MKNFNLIKRLWTDSHEKQKPQRFARYAAILIMLLTIGVGQMWGETLHVRGYNNNWSNQDFNLMTGTSSPWTFTADWTTNWEFKISSDADGKEWLGKDGDFSLGDKVEISNGGNMRIPGWSSGTYTITVTYENSKYYMTVTAGSGGGGGGGSSSYPDKYIAGGNEDWLSAQWDPDGDELTNNGDGTYTITVEDVTAEEHQFKLTNGSWGDGEVGWSSNVSCVNGSCSGDNDGANIKFTPHIRGNVTISYDGTYVVITCAKIPITLSRNGGSSDGSATVDVGASSLSSITHVSRTGYNLTGYWTLTSGGYKVINNDGTFVTYSSNVSTYLDNATPATWKKTSATTLNAQWTAKNYTASNNIKHADGTTAGQYNVNYDATSISYTTTPSKTGYNIEGLYYESGLSNKIVNSDRSLRASTSYTTSGSKWNQTSAPNLYVKWEVKTYTESGNLKETDGTSNGTYTATYNANTITINTTPTKSGYHVEGYYTSSGLGTKVAAANGNLVADIDGWTDGSSRWVKDANVPLYIKWAADAVNYTITYGVGTDYTSYGSVSEGHSYASGSSQASGTEISLSALPATHYKLEGWYSNAACSSAIDGAGTTNPYEFTLGTNTSVYAKFILKQCTITLNKNGGSTGASSVTASHGSTLPSFTAHTRTGYTLKGYYTDPSTGTKIINADGSLVASTTYADESKKWDNDATSLTLYAQWTANEYAVTFDKQSGSGGDNSVTATYGAAMPSVTEPTRTGYDFNGYYGSTGGSGTKYYNSDGSSANPWDVANATTIYAYWTAHNYTITYSPSSAPTGCSYNTKPTSCAYGNTATIVITPSTGYTVSVSAADASSNPVTLSNPSTNTYTFTQPASAVTVTVTTTEIKSTVTVNANQTSMGTLKFGETSKSWGTTASVGVTTTQSITATANSGYVFDRWVLSGGAATTSSLTSGTITLKGNGTGNDGIAKAVFGKTYYYRGDKNSNGATLMTRHESGYYAYFSTSGTHKFKCAASTSTWDYNTYDNSYGNIILRDANDGYGNVYCPESGSHYIMIFYPNTAVNSESYPVIAAGTALFDPSNAILTLTSPSTSTTSLYCANNPMTIGVSATNLDGKTSLTYSYEYSEDKSSWNTITPTSSTSDGGTASCVWTTPNVAANKTYYVRAKLTYTYEAATVSVYSEASAAIKVTGTSVTTKTIKVKKPADWDSFEGIHIWSSGDNDFNTSWPGFSIIVNHLGGAWYEFVIPSVCNNFVLNNGIGDGSSNPTKYQTVDLTYGSSITTGNCYVLDNKTDASDVTYSPQKTYKYNLTHTDDCPEEPTVSSSAATSVTNISATLNGSISDNGNDDITDYGFYWSTDANDDTAAEIAENGTKVQKGTSDKTGSFTHALTITAGTTYRYIAYATNGLGTTLSTVQTFTAPYNVTISTATGCSTLDPAAGSHYMRVGDNVSATATAGYTFSNWSATNVTLGSPTTTTGVTTSSISSFSADNATIAPVYTENKTSITITTDGHGTITTPSPNSGSYSLGVATTQVINASPSTGYSWSTWTTSGTAALGSSATTQSNTAKGDGTNGGSGTITATFTPNPYDVILDVNGGSGDNQTVTATFDAAMPTTLKGGSDPIAARTKTGYNFDGYWSTTTGTGTQYYTSALASNHIWDVATNETHIYAKWNAKSCDVVFDFDESDDGYGSKTVATAGTMATYDAAMTSVTPPTAAEGYAFMGYFTAADGGGTQYYDGDGHSDANWAEDTESETTLYAYYKKAEITNIAFTGGAVVAPNTSKTVTATISPTPTGTTTVCWRVLYSNDNPLDPQPEFSSVSGNSVSFTAPEASGMYKIEAVLHTGSGCGGTELSTYVANFQVAGEHTVTVQYHDGSGNSIKANTSVTGRPLVWSSGITAPDDIFGYIFEYWQAGDGITLSKDGSSAHNKDTAQVSTVYIKATYNGTLTAVYKPADILYFKNTMGWSNIYVYFYTSDKYWDQTYYGSGTWAEKQFCEKKKDDQGNEYDDCTMPYYEQKHGQLTRLGDTDIWYIDFGALGCADWHHLVFNANQQDNYEWFSATELVRRGDLSKGTPMFVPADKSTYNPTVKNGNAKYYNQGYWTKYIGDKTGYTLEIYNSEGNSLLKEIPLTGDENLMPMTAKADLEGGTNYKFQIRRDNNYYYGNGGTMTYANHGQGTPWAFTSFPGMCTITTTAAGDYKFTLTYSKDGSGNYELRMAVDYPISDGDYRLVYSDAVQTKPLTSAVVPHMANKDTIVSFFIRKAQSPNLRLQKATVAGGGAITWNEYPTSGTPTNQLTIDVLNTLPQDSVYNINLHMDGSSDLSVSSVTPYEGDFYIRTDGVRNKWDNFRAADHLMTYSEYAEKNSGFTHYFMSHVYGGTSVKFVVANDYAPNISDTLVQQAGDAGHVDASGKLWYDASSEANIRFMWNRHDNSVGRAYLAAAKTDGSKFLVLRANSSEDMMDEDGNALLESATSEQAGYNHGAPDNSMQFVDDENWIYETTVKVKPGAYVKLYAHYHGEDFYYKGINNSTFDADNAIQILGGSGAAEKLHVVYDFKTGRLVSAWMPSGNISTERAIHADVMFVREHQGDIEQLTFSNGGKITEINTAYAVMRFNKWTLNNKSKESGHDVLDPLLSNFERDLFYVSFPFRVNLEEVFGFGTYGTHWIIEEYDGAARAANGFWADTETFWRFVTNRKGKFLEPNTGYILALDLDELGESSSVWDNGVEQVELYFPSYGAMPNITSSSVTYEVPAHTCTIGPRFEGGDDRRIKDSHWNLMSVPTYVNTDDVTFASTDWITTADDEHLGPNFLYTVNWNDNSLSARSGKDYTYHAMHAYIVQFCGDVTWTSSVSPALAARRNEDAPKDVEYRLELRQNDQMVDQTFIRLSDDEHVTTGFDFNYDLSKEFNKNKANIYTMVSTMIDGDLSVTQTAGNVLPMTEQTTVIPVGVKIAANGDYTFAIPEGTNGVGVTLFDTETGIYTQLGALDYTIYLNAGTYDGRFILEISPIRPISTDLENTEYRIQNTDVRKVLIDDLLYIVKDGRIFDAQGKRLQ